MFPCPGCNERFLSSRAAANHRKSCTPFDNAVAHVFAKRKRDIEDLAAIAEERRRALADAMASENAAVEQEVVANLEAQVSLVVIL
jgi:hypothetical protein